MKNELLEKSEELRRRIGLVTRGIELADIVGDLIDLKEGGEGPGAVSNG